MSSQPPTPSSAAAVSTRVPPPGQARVDGLTGVASLEEPTEKRVDEIEMIGEEEAAGFQPAAHSLVTPGMRYLHCSRTIHQLVNDRNRAVGLYLAVASLLWTASSAMLNARPRADLIIPIETIQSACLPATFGTLAVLAVFVGFLLIRTRVGLIYEVAKMNALLGLPVGRVRRINPLGIFFIMHQLISLAGGCSTALLVYHLFIGAGAKPGWGTGVYAILSGLAVFVFLTGLYAGMVLYTTADKRLRGGLDG
jgi:hypothetical protein